MFRGTGTCSITATKAADSDFNSATSAAFAVTINKANQTISFTAPGSAVYGSTFNVAPTSDSGLAVSVARSGGCTVAAGVGGSFDVTMTSGSTDCVLTASQAGNANYNAATDVVKTVTALKKAQTITFAAPASPAVYNTTFHVGPSSDSGLDVSLAGTAGVCSVTPVSQVNGGGFDVTMLTGTGTCTLTASQAGDSNYSAASDVSHDVAAAKANQTISFTAPGSAVYGSTFNVAPTSHSGLAVSVARSGGCTVAAGVGGSFDVTMTSGSTDCVLTASQAGDDDLQRRDRCGEDGYGVEEGAERAAGPAAPSMLSVVGLGSRRFLGGHGWCLLGDAGESGQWWWL